MDDLASSSHPENFSEIPELKIPEFDCSIPETALNKLQPEIAEIMRMQNITMQYSKWQCNALAQIHMQTRKTNGRVTVLEKKCNDSQKILEKLEEDAPKIKEMYSWHQKLSNWKSLLIIMGAGISGFLALVWQAIPYL
jgi:uncharacterized FAD-dependent dehydrogenase